jgi:hypothetical protein
VSARTGCGLVEIAVLESLPALAGVKSRSWSLSSGVLADVEERIGLGPAYSYPVVADLSRPLVVPIPLVIGRGDFGDRTFPDPAPAQQTEVRRSNAGQLVLDAEAHRQAPVPIGIINGNTYRGGMRPALDPSRVIRALRRLTENPDTGDGEIAEIAGRPYSASGCDVEGDMAALLRGRRTELSETAKVSIVNGPSQDRSAESHRQRVDATGSFAAGPGAGGGRGRPDLIIESLPSGTSVPEVLDAIGDNVKSASEDIDLANGPGLPRMIIANDPGDASPEFGVAINIWLLDSSDPNSVRDRLLALKGMQRKVTWQFPAPLPQVMRSWFESHSNEDLPGSLASLEGALEGDQRRRS